MIALECSICHRYWTQPCSDCATESATKHTQSTGHQPIRIREER